MAFPIFVTVYFILFYSIKFSVDLSLTYIYILEYIQHKLQV